MLPSVFSSLRARLVLLVFLALLPALALILYRDFDERDLAREEVQTTALRLAELAVTDQGRVVTETRDLLGHLVQLREIRERDATACGPLVADLLRRHPRYANLGAIAADGTLFCSALPVNGPVNLADQANVRRALATRAFAVGEYQIGRLTRRATVDFGLPAVDAAGEIHAVAFAALDLARFNQLVVDARLPRNATLTVVDQAGRVLIRHPDPEQWVGRLLPQATTIETALTRPIGVAEAAAPEGGESFSARMPLLGTPGGDLYVSLAVYRGGGLAEVNRLLFGNLLALGVVAVMALGAVWVAGHWMVFRRVDTLVRVTKRLGAGDLSARMGSPYAPGELGQLARGVDEMAGALQRRQAEATETEAQLQRQRETLYQSEKLAAMGQLLAGVAHELNNPLSVVIGQASLLQQTAADTPMATRAHKIGQAAERCGRIVKNFLALARQRPPERQHVRLNQVIEEVAELFAYPFRVDSVEVTTELASGLPLLWADPHQLHQILVNLMTNARDAMRATPPPRRLTLTTRFDASRQCVALEVADTGPGIPPEIQAQLFQPFFTTKPPGQGTGLGLSLVQDIIQSHGGVIRVESPPGQGAHFVIELPAQAPPATEKTDTRASDPLPGLRGQTILIVDDEPEIARVLAEILTGESYQVETAGSGTQALDKLSLRPYDLILSDLRMPELDGPGLYRELERRDPSLTRRIIFLTGDTLDPDISLFLERSGAPNLAKPFTLPEVRRVVQQVLGTQASG